MHVTDRVSKSLLFSHSSLEIKISQLFEEASLLYVTSWDIFSSYCSSFINMRLQNRMESDLNDADELLFMKLGLPGENVRVLFVGHMTGLLASSPRFTRRWGLLSDFRAREYASEIEYQAFAAAFDYASENPDADAISTLQVYEKETSRIFVDAERSDVREAFPEIAEKKESDFDISAGEREFLDTCLAMELFRPLEKELKDSCTRVRFGNKSFGVEAACVAESVLMGVQKTLKDVELVDFYFKRPEADALVVMSIFSSAFKGCVLRSLSLELGELGEKGLSAFGPLLKSQKMLEELKFIDTTIYGGAARAICEFLPSIERIKCLHFSNNDSGDNAAETLSEVVKKCNFLEDFKFSKSFISIQGAKALAEALSKGSRLKMLNLKDNMFGTIGGVALSQVIYRHPGLTEVYFDCMNLEDEGAVAIADSLKDAAPALRVVAVGGNAITSKAAPALAACLAVKDLLTLFNARDNMLGDDGSIIICKAISKGHEQLKELDLSSNRMTDIGAEAAAKAISNKPDFRGLFIYRNLTTRKGSETIRNFLIRQGTMGDSVLRHNIPFDWRECDSYRDTEMEVKRKKLKVKHVSEVTQRSVGFSHPYAGLL